MPTHSEQKNCFLCENSETFYTQKKQTQENKLVNGLELKKNQTLVNTNFIQQAEPNNLKSEKQNIKRNLRLYLESKKQKTVEKNLKLPKKQNEKKSVKRYQFKSIIRNYKHSKQLIRLANKLGNLKDLEKNKTE